jgi:secretion/DNA translocation related CpaE-like protein
VPEESRVFRVLTDSTEAFPTISAVASACGLSVTRDPSSEASLLVHDGAHSLHDIESEVKQIRVTGDCSSNPDAIDVSTREGRTLLAEQLSQSPSPRSRSLVLAVMGSRGGSGASTLSIALAQAAARSQRGPCLVDCDPAGGGLDLALGLEEVSGPRWQDFWMSEGSISLDALAPIEGHSLALMTWRRGGSEIDDLCAARVFDLLQRRYQTLIIDLPSRKSALRDLVVAQADALILLVPAEVRAVASAALLVDSLRREVEPSLLHLVVRIPGPARIPTSAIAEMLNIPLIATMKDDPRIALSAEHGPPRSPSLRQTADSVLKAVT